MTPELIDIWFCDDIREEKDGRYSMMGVYPSKVVAVQQLPTVLNQFNIVMRFSNIQEEAVFLQVKITAPDGQESKPVQAQKLTSLTEDGDGLFILCAAPMQLSQEGQHIIQIKIGEKVSSNNYFMVEKMQ